MFRGRTFINAHEVIADWSATIRPYVTVNGRGIRGHRRSATGCTTVTGVWQPEEKEILGLFRQGRVLTSVLGVLSLRRGRGQTGVSNSTSPRFSHVFCGSSMMLLGGGGDNLICRRTVEQS